MKTQIFLDLDGLIRDFSRGLIDHFKMDHSPEDVTHWGYSVDKITKKYGFTEDEFWNCLTYQFWSTLPMTPYANRIINIMRPLKPTILTSPAHNSAGPTQAWIKENLPAYFNDGRYLIGPAKESCAHENALLIDDSEENCVKFYQAGGDIIMFPGPWNSAGKALPNMDPVSFLIRELDVRSLLKHI